MQLPADQECGCITPPKPNAYKLQARGPSFSMSALRNENKSRKCGLREWPRRFLCQWHPYLSHRAAFNTQHSSQFPPLLLLFHQETKLFPSPLPGCIQSSVFLAELSECPVINPLLPLSCFRKSPLSSGQMTRRGNIYNDVRNSQLGGRWRSKIILSARSIRSLACEGPP